MSDKKEKKEKKLNKFFNEFMYESLLYLCEDDVFKSIDGFETYLETFPHDYPAYCMLASNLIRAGRFEDAKKILDNVEKKFEKDARYNDLEKEKLFRKNFAFTMTKYLCYTGKYEECISYCSKNKELLLGNNINLGLMIAYCNKQLGRDIGERGNENSYLYNQLIEYREEDFRNHIRKHLVDYKTDEEIETSIFFSGFPIDKVLEEARKVIPNDNKACFGFIDNYYYFKYDGNGKCVTDKDRHRIVKEGTKKASRLVVTDYFKIVTLHNTNQMITITPCNSIKGFPYIDFNYLKEEKEDEPKVQRKNGVERFKDKWYK